MNVNKWVVVILLELCTTKVFDWSNCAGSLDFALQKLLISIYSSSKDKMVAMPILTILNLLIYAAWRSP